MASPASIWTTTEPGQQHFSINYSKYLLGWHGYYESCAIWNNNGSVLNLNIHTPEMLPFIQFKEFIFCLNARFSKFMTYVQLADAG
jgi:hypothetical protein